MQEYEEKYGKLSDIESTNFRNCIELLKVNYY